MYSLHGHSVRQMLFSLYKPLAENFIGENLENVFEQGKKFNKKRRMMTSNSISQCCQSVDRCSSVSTNKNDIPLTIEKINRLNLIGETMQK